MTKIIIDRMREPIRELRELRENQAGFRSNRSCIDHICTLRLILEEVAEKNEEIHINFIDFEKAFDSVKRERMWDILRLYGVPEKFIKILKMLYEEYIAKIEHEGSLSEGIKLEKGVRQGCRMSPLLFIITMDWVMERTEDRKSGIIWEVFKRLEDLEFADDICLLATRKKHVQDKTKRLERNAHIVGLKINAKKTKLLTNNETEDNIIMDDKEIEEVKEFCYLGSIISVEGGTEKDIEIRLSLAQKSFKRLNKIWSSTILSRKNKIRIFRSNVKSILLYGAETWKNCTSIGKIQTFINKCLRIICGIFWPNTITNEELHRTTEEEKVERTIRKNRWKWIGHTLRKNNKSIARQALSYKIPGKRRTGRPNNTWRRTINEELQKQGLTWTEARNMANNRQTWKELVERM
ncbi:unnamed protein product [Brassicogethes aeneus]|uniref:Reverse transcriptase domain-containing protein n=1 Tax=Brassicogethes aeneus TaxID=1431903 RepID=A0A9P0AXX2_BRAAE|nr:unnamed protein product [Brassicogethes aeneus]